jgi:geranylgeranyl pyrophosphate synthase
VSAITVETPAAPEKAKKASTSHLKIVPETKALREQIRAEAARFVATLDRSRPLTRSVLHELSEQLLQRMGLGKQYTGFTAVCLGNEFWREQLMAVDFSRRLLLLPHCLKHAEGCPADYDEFGLDCRKCGACSVADFKVQAEDLGYKVLVAEGSPIVLKIIVSGHVDAIVGVSCLNVLEKAIDKVLTVGVPSIAIPLLSSNCKSTSVDEDWVREVIGLRTEPKPTRTKTYVHLMRAANQMFDQDMDRLLPPARTEKAGAAGLIGRTEQIAFDWLRQGGKRFRPFITLAGYDALKGAPGTLGEDRIDLNDSVRRVAMAMEIFHKASLVHDDIEDDDAYRYGQETLHRKYGINPAINIGDYLIGLGNRVVARERQALGSDCAADVLNKLSEAHLKLSEGQGAELFWKSSADRALAPLDALKIYALKTAPAFEAALYSGLRLAGPTEQYDKMITEFCRHLGVAFQVLNDLEDWGESNANKLVAGQDVLSARPTLLLALALEAASASDRQELLTHLQQPSVAAFERVRAIFNRCQVFEKAEKLVDKYRARAEALADEVEPIELREFLYFLVDTVLERTPATPPEEPKEAPLFQLGLPLGAK